MKSKVIKDKKILARVYLCTKTPNENDTKEKYVSKITREIRDTTVGYAGFSKKKYLKEFLLQQIFGSDNSQLKSHGNLDNKEVITIIQKTLETIKQILPSDQTKIYTFLSYDTFTKEKMQGTSGYTPWKGVMLLFIDPTTDWKKSLEKTIAHEYIHTLSRQYHEWNTLGDSLVFEGLAENFVQNVFKRKLSPWSSALSEKESKKYFKKLSSKLSSKEYSEYRDVFFTGTNYPLWAGYAIGYQLMKKYIEKQNKLSWQNLIETKPDKIIQEVNF